MYFAHGGGFVPYQLGRFDHSQQVREECQGLPATVSAYFRRLYFDNLVHDSRAIAFLAEVVGVDHIVVGTDHPFDMGETEPLTRVRSVAGLSARSQQAILADNAARLVNL
jgi:aminocarboxymuconate-semialdehyde decarboxylase